MASDPLNEQHYNARAAVPEHPELIARWLKRSQDWRNRATGRYDLAYGASPAERLDLFPCAADNAPLLVFIHGGYWQALDKNDFSFVAEPYVEAGASVAIVNYGLCPSVTLDDIVQQMRRAICWLYENSSVLGFDRARMHVSGHSAGGHLAAMLVTTDGAECASKAPDKEGEEAAGPLPGDVIKGAISVSGLFDLAPLIETTMNEKIGLDGESARRLSPSLLQPRPDAKLLVAVGEWEGSGFFWQVDSILRAWADHDIAIERMTLLGCNHFSALDRLADPASLLFRAVAGTMGLAKP